MERKISPCALYLALLAMPVLAVAATDSLPPWYAQQQPNTASVLYGYGAGSNTEKAKQAALADLAGRIVTEVAASTKTEIQVSTRNGKTEAQERVDDRVETEVKAIEIGDYNVEQAAQAAGQSYVMVSVAKPTLAARASQAFVKSDDELKAFFAQFSAQSRVKQFLSLREADAKLELAETKRIVVTALDGNFDEAPSTERYAQYRKAIAGLHDSFEIGVEYQGDTKEFAEILVTLISESGIPARLRAPPYEGPKVKVSGEFRESEIAPWKYAKADVLLDTLDERGQQLSSSRQLMSARAMTDHATARRNAAQGLAKALREDGVLAVLGLDQ